MSQSVPIAALTLLALLLAAACKEEPDTQLEEGEACPVTVPPQPGFAAPAPWATTPPAPDVWFGDADLWTPIPPDGARWTANDRGRYELRQLWFSDNYAPRVEDAPDLSLVAKRLDGPEVVRNPGPATGASRPVGEFWEFMIAGVSLPTSGCWQIAASYKGATLSYVALIEDPPAP